MAAKKKTRKKTGRRTLYKAEMNEFVERLCMLGLTDEELAHTLKVTDRTIYRWKLSHPEFCHAIKRGREEADGHVAHALYNRATGARVNKQQPFKLKRVFYDELGRRCEDERIEIAEFEEEVPPDTGAAAFWLKNRRSDKWSDKPVMDHPNNDKDELNKALSNAAEKLWEDNDTPEEVPNEEDDQ